MLELDILLQQITQASNNHPKHKNHTFVQQTHADTGKILINAFFFYRINTMWFFFCRINMMQFAVLFLMLFKVNKSIHLVYLLLSLLLSVIILVRHMPSSQCSSKVYKVLIMIYLRY